MRKKAKNPNDQFSDTVVDSALKKFEDYLEKNRQFYSDLSKSAAFRQFLDSEPSFINAIGASYNAYRYYEHNPYPRIPDSMYAAEGVIRDVAQDRLINYIFAAFLDVDALPLDIYVAMRALDAMYPAIKKRYEEDLKFRESLTPEERAAIDQNNYYLCAANFGCANPYGVATVNHKVLEGLDSLSNAGIDLFNNGALGLSDYANEVVKAALKYIRENSSLSDPEVTQAIDSALSISSIVKDISSNYNLSIDITAGMLKDYLLDQSPSLSNLSNDDNGKADLPSGERRKAIEKAIAEKVDGNGFLKSFRKAISDAGGSLEQRLKAIRDARIGAEVREIVKESNAIGNLVSQLGQITKSPDLYKAGVVFKNGVQIISALKGLNGIAENQVFQKIIRDLGAVSVIASSVLSIISLFVSTGPTAQQVIINQLNEIQAGINNVLQNQKVIMNALDHMYHDLLVAIDDGFKHLADMMQSEFDRMSSEHYQLYRDINDWGSEIINMLHRIELPIDAILYQPLEDALDYAENFEARNEDMQLESTRQTIRRNLRTLEQWGISRVCDRSLNGDTETDYSAILEDTKAIREHFRTSDITLKNLLEQMGFLNEVFLNIVTLPNSEARSECHMEIAQLACNMEVQLNIVSAYIKLAKIAMPLRYDPNGAQLLKMLDPSNKVKKIIYHFQEKATQLFSTLGLIIFGKNGRLDKFAKNVAEQVNYHLQKPLLEQNEETLIRGTNKVTSFMDSLTLVSSVVSIPHAPFYTIDGPNPVNWRKFAEKYKKSFKHRAEHPEKFTHALAHTPLASGRGLTTDRGDKDIDVPTEHLFPFLTDDSDTKLPEALPQAQFFRHANITAAFRYLQPAWEGNTLSVEATLELHRTNKTSVIIARSTWTGVLEYKPDLTGQLNTAIQRKVNQEMGRMSLTQYAGNVLNKFPVYPGIDPNCSFPILSYNFGVDEEHRLACMRWTYEVNYMVPSNATVVTELARQNHATIGTRIQEANLFQQLETQSEIGNTYEQTDANWALVKAFSFATSRNYTALSEARRFHPKEAFNRIVSTINNYDFNSGVNPSSMGVRSETIRRSLINAFFPSFISLSGLSGNSNQTGTFNATQFNSTQVDGWIQRGLNDTDSTARNKTSLHHDSPLLTYIVQFANQIGLLAHQKKIFYQASQLKGSNSTTSSATQSGATATTAPRSKHSGVIAGIVSSTITVLMIPLSLLMAKYVAARRGQGRGEAAASLLTGAVLTGYYGSAGADFMEISTQNPPDTNEPAYPATSSGSRITPPYTSLLMVLVRLRHSSEYLFSQWNAGFDTVKRSAIDWLIQCYQYYSWATLQHRYQGTTKKGTVYTYYVSEENVHDPEGGLARGCQITFEDADKDPVIARFEIDASERDRPHLPTCDVAKDQPANAPFVYQDSTVEHPCHIENRLLFIDRPEHRVIAESQSCSDMPNVLQSRLSLMEQCLYIIEQCSSGIEQTAVYSFFSALAVLCARKALHELADRCQNRTAAQSLKWLSNTVLPFIPLLVGLYSGGLSTRAALLTGVIVSFVLTGMGASKNVKQFTSTGMSTVVESVTRYGVFGAMTRYAMKQALMKFGTTNLGLAYARHMEEMTFASNARHTA